MPFIIDKDFALFYGIMLGDGCLSLVRRREKFISITGSSCDDLPFFKDVISPILLKLRGKETNIKFRKDSNAIDFNFVDFKLFDFIHAVGFPIGKKGTEISIPSIFYEKDLIKYVLQGFMATDGSLVLTKNPNKYYPRLEAHVIAKDLVKEFYEYLLKMGLKGNFYKCKRKKDVREWNTKEQYRFQFNGKDNLILFDRVIGFVNPKMKEKYNKFIGYLERYSNSIKGIPAQQKKFIRDKIFP